MKKAEFIAELAKRIDVPKTDASRFLDGMIEVVLNELQQGKSIALTGFCTISVDKRAERQGRHPQTGEAIKIPAKNVVKIKPGNLLKEIVNEQ